VVDWVAKRLGNPNDLQNLGTVTAMLLNKCLSKGKRRRENEREGGREEERRKKKGEEGGRRRGLGVEQRRGKPKYIIITLKPESTDNMTAIIVQFTDGRDHNSPVTFLPGPSKIPKKCRPQEQSQTLFTLAYIENAKAAGYTLEEADEIKKKMGIKAPPVKKEGREPKK
jgi:hypothetical protein